MFEVELELVRSWHVEAEAAARNRLQAIRLAREAGASWQQIGAVMLMSRQMAHKRFGREVGEPGED